MPEVSQRLETRELILHAAAELFGRNGFDGTGLREIVRVAGVNLSAVNYYFGTKEQLYGEVIRHVLAESIRTQEWSEELNRLEVRSAQEVSDLLYRMIRTLFLNYVGLDKSEWYAKLLNRALLESDPRVESAFVELQEPTIELLHRVLPGLVSQQCLDDIEFWIVSVFAQVHHYLIARNVLDRTFHRQASDQGFLDKAASYVARNSVIVLGLPAPRAELCEPWAC